ncbi:MAG: DUF6036 family nucleotidyltransferase [Myxococcota bacterium]
MHPRPTLEAFDQFLHARDLRTEAVIIGGTALVLLGVIERATRDVDVLAPELSPIVLESARAFAREQRDRGVDLADDWLNNGPSLLGDALPSGWRERTERVFTGRALRLDTLGRMDLLRSKLFALCDRGTDLLDCLALKPDEAEIDQILPWLADQDGNPDWPAYVRQVLTDLRRRLHHAL